MLFGRDQPVVFRLPGYIVGSVEGFGFYFDLYIFFGLFDYLVCSLVFGGNLSGVVFYGALIGQEFQVVIEYLFSLGGCAFQLGWRYINSPCGQMVAVFEHEIPMDIYWGGVL